MIHYCECGWKFNYSNPGSARCPQCRQVNDLPLSPRECSSDLEKRKTYCINCKFRVPKGCSLYLKPCTVKRLWADQIDPPTNCPKQEQFYE